MTRQLPLLITRPAGKADNLLASLDELDFPYLYQPLITTSQVAIKQQDLPHLRQAQLLVFVSVSAVICLQPQVQAEEITAPLYAVGKTTAAVLERWLNRTITVPEDQRSEGLLALPAMQDVKDKQVVIVRGNGGRELIKQQLLARGAIVRYVQSYKRIPLPLDGTALGQQWQQAGIRCIVVTSDEILQLLFSLLPAQYHDWLCQCYWVLVSPRMQQSAQQLGIPATHITLAANANDLALLEAIKQVKRDYQ